MGGGPGSVTSILPEQNRYQYQAEIHIDTGNGIGPIPIPSILPFDVPGISIISIPDYYSYTYLADDHTIIDTTILILIPIIMEGKIIFWFITKGL